MRVSAIVALVGIAVLAGMWGAAKERSRNADNGWAPRGNSGGESIMPLSRAAVIDVETTGFSPATGRIVAVGVVLVDFSRLDGEFVAGEHKTMEITVDPGIPIP